MNKYLTGNKFMLFLLIWFILAQLLLPGTLMALEIVFDFNATAIFASPAFIIILQLVVLILPLMVWLQIKKDKLTPNMPNWKLGGTNIALIILLSFLLQPAMMTISGITSLFTPNIVSDMIYGFVETPLWLLLLGTAVTPAICEELVFRGYIQTQHQNRTVKQAAILNGLFFAIIHLSMSQFAYAFILGVVFFYMVHYTRSIWAGILPHFIINATQVSFGRWAFIADMPEAVTEVDPYTEELLALLDSVSPELLAIVVMGGLTLLLTPVIIIIFREFIKHNRWRMIGEYTPQTTASASTYWDYESASTTDNNYVSPPYTAVPNHDTTPPTYPDTTIFNTSSPEEEKPVFFDSYVVWTIVIFIAFVGLTALL